MEIVYTLSSVAAWLDSSVTIMIKYPSQQENPLSLIGHEHSHKQKKSQVGRFFKIPATLGLFITKLTWLNIHLLFMMCTVVYM